MGPVALHQPGQMHRVPDVRLHESRKGTAAPTPHTTTADRRTKDLHHDTDTEGDSFGATTAMRYIAYLTIAYLARAVRLSPAAAASTAPERLIPLVSAVPWAGASGWRPYLSAECRGLGETPWHPQAHLARRGTRDTLTSTRQANPSKETHDRQHSRTRHLGGAHQHRR